MLEYDYKILNIIIWKVIKKCFVLLTVFFKICKSINVCNYYQNDVIISKSLKTVYYSLKKEIGFLIESRQHSLLLKHVELNKENGRKSSFTSCVCTTWQHYSRFYRKKSDKLCLKLWWRLFDTHIQFFALGVLLYYLNSTGRKLIISHFFLKKCIVLFLNKIFL